jgi:GNAT superfamily N-acetyltransferase
VNVELLEPSTVSDADAAALHECAVECSQAMRPDEPTQPLVYIAHRLRHPGTARPHRSFVAWDDARARILGYVETVWHDGSYTYMVETDLNVRPEARRSGIGTRLVEAVAEAARAQGRRSLLGSAPYLGPGIDFAKAMGAKFGLDEYRSRLFLKEANTDASPVEGFSLVRFTTRCPERYAASYTRMLEVMNTAPQGGDIEWPDDAWDVERLRRIEAHHDELHLRPYVMTARDDETGELVALAMAVVFDDWPEVGEQWDTAVHPDYRLRGLARWVKAEAAKWMRADRPELVLLSTWNAAVNDSMLAVNVGLGYRDRERWIEAELSL